MAEETIVGQPLAEQAARLAETHRQATVVVGSDVQAVAFAEQALIVGRFLLETPHLPELAELFFRQNGRAERLLQQGGAAALGRRLVGRLARTGKEQHEKNEGRRT